MNIDLILLERVASQSLDVRINQDKIKEYCSGLTLADFKHWSEFSPVQLDELDLNDEQKMAFLFVFNTLSFGYWGQEKWKVDYEGRDNSRATWSMQLALKRAIDEGIDILNPQYLAWISRDDLGYVLRGNVEIPMLDERTSYLNYLGETISEDYGCSFQALVATSQHNALILLDYLVEELYFFSDTRMMNGNNINFHKKAQLLVSDISHYFYPEDPLHDDWKLTGCADYILPMVLRHYGILEYSTELAEIVDDGVELMEGMHFETEIRANTVLAVDLMKTQLHLQGVLEVTPMMVNDHLWIKADSVPQEVEYHRTRTINY